MIKRFFFLLAAILAAALPSQADFSLDQATQHHADCSSPALASSPDGVTMLAFFAKGDPLLQSFVHVQKLTTLRSDIDDPLDPVLLNSGSGPVICWSRTGFHVAFSSAGMVLIYHADPRGNWDLNDFELLPTGGEVMGLDILGIATDAAGPDVMLTVHMSTDPPSAGHHVLYAAHTSSGWSQLQDVAGLLQAFPHPQITWGLGPAGPWPRIFFHGGDPFDPVLQHTTFEDFSAWTTPVPVPGAGVSSPIAGFFDVLNRNGLNFDLLGMGAQPVCPCGAIFHQEFLLGGGWTDGENLTVAYADYDWPRSPRLAVGPEGQLHAFWIQQASGTDLMPLRTTLEYWVREGEIWRGEGASLNGPWPGHPTFGQVALAGDPGVAPVLAWSRQDTVGGEPQPQQIWVARKPDVSPVRDPGLIGAKLNLTAWPNPFNPSVTIAFGVERTQHVNLMICDARGRQVAELLARAVAPGRTDVTWQGQDDNGRHLPSGVYFARLVVGPEVRLQRLVLLK